MSVWTEDKKTLLEIVARMKKEATEIHCISKKRGFINRKIMLIIGDCDRAEKLIVCIEDEE